MNSESSGLRSGTSLVTNQQSEACTSGFGDNPGKRVPGEVRPGEESRRRRASAGNDTQEERTSAALRIPGNEERLAFDNARRGVNHDGVNGGRSGDEESGEREQFHCCAANSCQSPKE